MSGASCATARCEPMARRWGSEVMPRSCRSRDRPATENTPRGDRASSLAVAIVEAAFTGQSLDELGAALRAANTAIFERAAESEGLEGMGTTVCAAGLTQEGRLVVANVGDSRAYLLRGGALQQLTEDHSVTAAMVRRGELTEEDAPRHPHHSVLTRAVGVGPTVE
jgi:serine/threonine protein phosphatase PrpC